MLVLGLKEGQKAYIDGTISVSWHRGPKGQIRLAIEAPKALSVRREEIRQEPKR